jgi:hypothetical protein
MSKEPAPKDKNYVSSKEFRRLLEEYYETDKMTNELAINVMKIAEGLSYNWRFIGYTKSWKEDMVGDAVIKMYAALESKKFNIESEFNPFSYFNQIAWNAFSNRIKKEKKQHDGLQEYKQMVYEDEMTNPNMQGTVYVKPIMDNDENDGCYDD